VGHTYSTWHRCLIMIQVPPEGAHLNKGYFHQSRLFRGDHCNFPDTFTSQYCGDFISPRGLVFGRSPEPLVFLLLPRFVRGVLSNSNSYSALG
jgi:hypothetical protein